MDILAKPRKPAPDWLADNIEQAATDAWIAVDRLSTADARDIRPHRQAILEMQERINRMAGAL